MIANLKPHLVSLGVVVLFGLVAGGSLDTDRDTKAVQSQAPSYSVSAEHLASEYKENEVAADMKYKGRVVAVSGKVESIGKDIMDQAYIVVGGEGFLDGVQCTFTEAQNLAVAQVSKGQSVRLKGEVTGKMGNVQVKNCQLQ